MRIMFFLVKGEPGALATEAWRQGTREAAMAAAHRLE